MFQRKWQGEREMKEKENQNVLEEVVGKKGKEGKKRKKRWVSVWRRKKEEKEKRKEKEKEKKESIEIREK